MNAGRVEKNEVSMDAAAPAKGGIQAGGSGRAARWAGVACVALETASERYLA
ncbi:hypothetical protein [Nitrosovibrio sp. Nv17]|jgi:hypothetical protein|uniref:hypothetical protein n=1 Tax=Nitrosovibrio sp. Nv17 TaxID=1855339 RepID=UPI000908E2CC|nr:hypothetical protein [Nitrosovibrio sp. Nv17]SFW30606.1 hypothetical protein SAMN05216414_11429 [Nitrosovibrio sp. Nv17]